MVSVTLTFMPFSALNGFLLVFRRSLGPAILGPQPAEPCLPFQTLFWFQGSLAGRCSPTHQIRALCESSSLNMCKCLGDTRGLTAEWPALEHQLGSGGSRTGAQPDPGVWALPGYVSAAVLALRGWWSSLLSAFGSPLVLDSWNQVPCPSASLRGWLAPSLPLFLGL